jgi:hypothetical protein
LVTAHIHNGTTLDFTYSDIVDNFSVLDDNTYGKRVRRLMCGDIYGGTFTNLGSVPNLSHSHHLLASEVSSSAYTVFDTGYYQTRISTLNSVDPASERIVKTEFFFD